MHRKLTDSMTLLRDIQDAAIGTDVPIATVLRKAQVLAARLDHEPLRAWVMAELDGYDNVDDLPDYRRIGQVPVLGHFSGPGGSSTTNRPLPPRCVPENFREFLFTHNAQEGVAVLEAIVQSGPNAKYPWPSDVVAEFQEDFIEYMALVQAFKAVSTTILAGVLDTVRNRLLAFVIDIEKLDPHAGEVAPGAPAPVADAAVSQVFHNNITGGTVTIAAAAQGDVSQQVQTKIDSAETWEDVRGTLREWGLPEDDIADLGSAIARDRQTTGSSTDLVVVGDRTRSWIGNFAGKVAGGTVQLAKNVSTDVITALLTKAAGG